MIKTENASAEVTSTGCSAKKYFPQIIIALLCINIITTVASSYVVLQNNLKIEYDKVGGKQNFEDLNVIQSKQATQYLDQQRQQNPDMFKKDETTKDAANSGSTANTNTQANDGLSIKTMDVAKVKALKEGYPSHGNKDARIVIFEYSDFDCPFCLRQFNEKILSKMVEAYKDQVQTIFKPAPMVHKETAEVKSEAALCVKELAGDKAYLDFVDKVFTKGDVQGQTADERKNDLLIEATEVGAKKDAVASCIDSKKHAATVESILTEGQALGLQGTPTSIVVDTKNGNYIVIGGAYPLDTFKQAVDKLLKQ